MFKTLQQKFQATPAACASGTVANVRGICTSNAPQWGTEKSSSQCTNSFSNKPHACLLFLSICASSPYKSAATAPLHQLPGSCIARSRAPAHQQGLCCRGSDCQALAVSPFPKHACLSAHAAAAAAQGHCVNWKTLPTISRPVGICSKQQQQRQQSEPVKLQLQQPTLCSTASLSTCTRKSLCDLASASILMRASSITVGASSITWGEHTAGQLPACIHRSD